MAFLSFGFFVNCTSHKAVKLTYLDSYEIAPNAEVDSTFFGGISGIDYNRKGDYYYLLSDDRSEHSAARMYTAKIDIVAETIDTVIIDSALFFSKLDKHSFGIEEVDLESIRYNPSTDLFIIGDEGGKKGKATIRMFDLSGRVTNSIEMDSIYTDNIRFNKSFEALSFSQDYKNLYYVTEAPLVSDGNVATLKDRGLLRIVKIDSSFITKESEFLYHLEKVPQKSEGVPPWEGPGSDNGLSELIALPSEQFLTLERSGAYQKNGSFNYICKVYQVFPTSSKGSLSKPRKTKKKLVLDFSTLLNGKYNIEGMTFGPLLDGRQKVLFISDNNFKKNIPTKFYLFQIDSPINE